LSDLTHSFVSRVGAKVKKQARNNQILVNLVVKRNSNEIPPMFPKTHGETIIVGSYSCPEKIALRMPKAEA
jgi:hypothetical protein